MNIVDRLRNDNTGLYVKANKVLKEGLEHDIFKYRTLYFENLIDVRTCNKNGGTTLQSIWAQLYTGNSGETFKQRRQLIQKAYYINYQNNNIECEKLMFRKNSYKIGIKRDPIDRALSAAKHVYKTRLNITNPSLEQIEELLNVASPTIDRHFLSQTFLMGGNVNIYDKIYDLQNLNFLIEWLENNYNYPHSIQEKIYNSSPKGINVSDLSEKTTKKLFKIYEIDYDNGWC